MTATTFTLRPAVVECGPDYYVVIGRLKGISPIARNRFDDLLYTAVGDVAMGAILYTSPDGIILQRGNDCFITDRQTLQPFDPARTDWTNRRQVNRAPDLTREDYAEMLKEAKRAAVEDYLRYDRRVI